MIILFFSNSTYSDKGASNASLPLAADSLELQRVPSAEQLEASNEDFHLSLPQYETPEDELHQKAVPGSSSSIDELCGRKKTKPDKEERFSKLSKKLFGKKDKEDSGHEDQILKSTENIPNGKETTLEEKDVDIEICPIDHVPDNDEPDIDIYPLDNEPPTAVDPVDNHLPNGLDSEESSSHVENKSSKDNQDVETLTINHVNVGGVVTSTDNAVASDDDLYQQVLSGNMDITIPNTAKIVRIFTSSTFTGKQQFIFRSINRLPIATCSSPAL